MRKTIYEMVNMLQQNNLMVSENARKKDEEKPTEGRENSHDGHTLMTVTSSPSTWILDSGDSNHMAANKESFLSIEECT